MTEKLPPLILGKEHQVKNVDEIEIEKEKRIEELVDVSEKIAKKIEIALAHEDNDLLFESFSAVTIGIYCIEAALAQMLVQGFDLVLPPTLTTKFEEIKNRMQDVFGSDFVEKSLTEVKSQLPPDFEKAVTLQTADDIVKIYHPGKYQSTYSGFVFVRDNSKKPEIFSQPWAIPFQEELKSNRIVMFDSRSGAQDYVSSRQTAYTILQIRANNGTYGYVVASNEQAKDEDSFHSRQYLSYKSFRSDSADDITYDKEYITETFGRYDLKTKIPTSLLTG